MTINGVTTQFRDQGDRQPVPRWSYTLGGQVTAPVERLGSLYARADFQHAGSFPRTYGPGTNGFFPDVYWQEATNYASARLGVRRDHLDLSLFASNLLNSQDVTSVNLNAGRGGCTYTNGAFVNCTRNMTYFKETTFRPRTIGVTARMNY